MYVRYNNNTHAMLEVNASLESPMQAGLHSESLWRACCVGQHCVLIHPIVHKSLVKYSKMLTKCLPRRERVKYFSVADFLLTRLLFFAKKINSFSNVRFNMGIRSTLPQAVISLARTQIKPGGEGILFLVLRDSPFSSSYSTSSSEDCFFLCWSLLLFVFPYSFISFG